MHYYCCSSITAILESSSHNVNQTAFLYSLMFDYYTTYKSLL